MFSYLSKSFEQLKPKYFNMYGSSHMSWLNDAHNYVTSTIKYIYIAVAKSNVFAPIISYCNSIDEGNY